MPILASATNLFYFFSSSILLLSFDVLSQFSFLRFAVLRSRMVIYHDRQPFYTSRAYDPVCRTWGTLLGLPMRPVFLIDCMEPVPRFDWEQLTSPTTTRLDSIHWSFIRVKVGKEKIMANWLGYGGRNEVVMSRILRRTGVAG